MEEIIIWVIIIIAIIILLLPVMLKYLLPGIYTGLAICAFYLFWLLDQLFSAKFFPDLPYLSWVIAGALIGIAFAFWTVAPRFGLREQRPIILLAPFMLILLTALVRLLLLAGK